MLICGEIVNYIFQNKDNNYRIFIVNDLENNRYTLCGYVLELQDDLIYDFTVEEVIHPRYGKQYQIVSYQIHQDNSREGIITYLSSNLFPGIGLISAQAIYDTLGDNCLELIEHNPQVLDNVTKLTKNQKEMIYHKIIENRVIEKIFVELYQIGLTPKMVMKLFEKYQENTLEIIKENPYRLIYDLEGIGFKKADELALKLGFSLDNSERLKALLVYTMTNLSLQYGLTYLSVEQIINSSYNYALANTNVSKDLLNQCLDLTIKDEKLLVENGRVYLPYLYYAETNLAKKINAILAMPKINLRHNLLESLIADFEKMNDFLLADLQKMAICNALSHRVSIITGGPGTGKTTIISAIVSIYCGLHGFTPFDDIATSKILLCAPTGKASKRMVEQTGFPASTIHRALGYNFESEFAFNANNQLPQQLIIIDEASMIDTVLAAHLFDAISINAQVVIVGDVFQLPSIGAGAVLKDLIDSRKITTTYLEIIYRQGEGSSIVQLADMIKSGYLDDNIFSNNADLKFFSASIHQIPDLIDNIISIEMNNGYSLQEDIQVLAPMYKGDVGIDALNRNLSDTFNRDYTYSIVHKDKTFKENDKVIQLTNSSENKIMNGDIGFLGSKSLMCFDDGDKEVYEVFFDDRRVKLLSKDFDNLNLAYATSIHKAQGSEYAIVIMPVVRAYYIMLKRKLLYTAVTRAKVKLYIIGDLNAFKMGLNLIEDNRQTSLAMRIRGIQNRKKINDPEIPFKDLGEENMEGITPYSFMV